ncbi:integral membrane protein possibly involved in chromosome condensation [Rhodococcus sp. RD6.2]|uniref:fluoride efflux transporter CrcB n=1 Tax=Rhodococcus sp. RD6.2 TaxID=260936 RepID=UPI00063B241D|nr:fluoride efflux transporter CrcB [Rhodococcus sp. RD6.2]CRK51575.1 integral membrane protein possibly involved in chromosome condensation [Rhodococcus sp. RD6.2]
MTVLLVVVGGAIGAPARYLLDRAVQSRHDSVLPWGTLCVNVIGSFVLGVLAGVGTAHDSALWTVLGTGFCGALTTFSTFGYETVRLLEDRARLFAFGNVAVTLVAGIGAAVAGFAAGAAIA